MTLTLDLLRENIILVLILSYLWTIPWKGLALWRASRNGHKAWFLVILLINTLAILEIIYIFLISKKTTRQ